MIYFLSFILVLAFAYFSYSIYFIYAITKNQNIRKKIDSGTKNTNISIVVPFRNESQRIMPLLQSLLNQNNQNIQFEILFVNDHSEDDSIDLIHNKLTMSNLPWSIIELPSNLYGKKQALRYGISMAKYEWIACTDADCIVSKNWLQEIHFQIGSENHIRFISGNVNFNFNSNASNFWNAYQYFENRLLILKTELDFINGKATLSNGANMVFNKKEFLSLNIFQKKTTVLSGDDEDILRTFSRVSKSGLVFSGAISVQTDLLDFSQLISQRIRWAGKALRNKNWKNLTWQVFIVLFNLVVLNSFLIAIIKLDWLYLTPLLLKAMGDFIFYSSLKNKFHWSWIPVISLVQLIFIPVIAILSLGNFHTWKGRKLYIRKV